MMEKVNTTADAASAESEADMDFSGLFDLDEIFSRDFYPQEVDFSNLVFDLEHQTDFDLLSGLVPSTSGSHIQQTSVVTSSNQRTADSRAVVQIPPKVPSILFSLAGASNNKKRKMSVSSSTSAAKSTVQPKEAHTSADLDSEENSDRKPGGRRERNREHAKASRGRKKVLLDSLSDQLTLLREQNSKLRNVITDYVKPATLATHILTECTTVETSLFDINGDHNNNNNNNNSCVSGGLSQHLQSAGNINNKEHGDEDDDDVMLHFGCGIYKVSPRTAEIKQTDNGALTLCGDKTQLASISVSTPGTNATASTTSATETTTGSNKVLMQPDYRLIQSLVTSQQNFLLTDPSLPDNPIVYASSGFCKLTGYKRSDILGRNCRFLQGPGTDQVAVGLIRQGILEDRDVSVCLLNYKADGTPFWNQFFLGALKDNNGKVVNFVGVQCEVNIIPVTELKEQVKRLPVAK